MAETIPLSPEAATLLAHLRRCCSRRELAQPDARIALVTGLPVRAIVDLADELLASEHLVIAECSDPKGRWLLGSGEDLAPSKNYDRTLLSRAIAIFRRRRHLKRGIAAAEARRAIESTGQRRLF